MPNMKKTKKHSSRTLPSIGNVSSSSITRIRIPANKELELVTIPSKVTGYWSDVYKLLHEIVPVMTSFTNCFPNNQEHES